MDTENQRNFTSVDQNAHTVTETETPFGVDLERGNVGYETMSENGHYGLVKM